MHYGAEIKRKRNPKEKANLLFIITFLFTFGFLKKGYKRDLTENDIYAVLPALDSAKLGKRLENEWLENDTTESKRSLYRLLWTCYGKLYLLLGVAQLVMKIFMVMVYPEAFSKLVSYFTAQSKLSTSDAAYYAFGVISLNIIFCTYNHNYMLMITELGISIRTAFCSLIYRKVLRMSNASLSKIGIGRIVTLISKDVNNFETFIVFLNDLWISVILLIIATCKMYSRMGTAALVGILFLILIIPLQVWLGRATSKSRLDAAKMTDRRLQATQESFSALKVIKMYAWENCFIDRISKARHNEMEKIRLIYFARATFLEIGSLVTSLATYIMVMTYIKLGNKFTAEIYSFLGGCFHILRSPITISIPLGIVNLAELLASLRRIRTVLAAEEDKYPDAVPGEPSVELRNVAVAINDKEVLKDISLNVGRGICCLSGKVGCGKSSLLKTILRDYPIERGEVKIRGTISYASQEPWLFPSSIKQNILFGQSYNGERYAQVLKVCGLERDLSNFLEGDETIIGDRGMNLSKGQQVRINLARAVYSNCDIYLIDDNLASLDTYLQDFIFDECIKNFLKKKVIIMVSHNERHLKQSNKIIIMDEGSIKSCIESSDVLELSEFSQQNDKEYYVVNESEEGRDVYHENKKEGKIDIGVYGGYCQYGGGIVTATFIVILFVVAQVASTYKDKLLSSWVNVQQKISEISSNSTEYLQVLEENEAVSEFYTVAVVASLVFFFVRAYTLFRFAGRASITLHNSMISSVMNATMKFCDTHYIGNVLNRCAKDISTIDENLPFNIYECLKFVCNFCGTFLLISLVNQWLLIAAIAVIILLLLVTHFYLPSARSLKRLDSSTRSPVIGHINASLEGLTTIKTHRNQGALHEEFDMHQNLYTSANYMLQSSARSFGYFLDLLCQLLTAVIVIIFLAIGRNVQAGNVGLAIRQSSGLNGLLQWGIRQWVELETRMTSVERVLEYASAEGEPRAGRVSNGWPQKGTVTYENVSLTFGNSKGYILKNIDFTVQTGEKVVIVGRSGIGKTSLISLLFRLYDYQGTISIDNVDIRTLPLSALRTNISVIPQDPVLFSGSIRDNIDPTGRYKDEEIWKAVNAANLKDFIPSLNIASGSGDWNYSSGQKQLVCLARAIIMRNKIVILDEATANLDLETELAIRKIIKECFDSCTVITIAHRLQTILDSDWVMVIDEGEIVETGNPKILIGREDSYFYKMLHKNNN